MRLAIDTHSKDMPLSRERLAALQERARLKKPLSEASDKPDFYTDHNTYLQAKKSYKCIGSYMELNQSCGNSRKAEVTYAQIATIFNYDPRKPQLLASKLPMPCPNPIIKTSKYVWKWHDVKHHVRRLVAVHVIKELATRL